jgi:hypothetical protein
VTNHPNRGFHARIARELGVTEAGLKVLFRLKRGDNISGNNAGVKLQGQGFVTGYDYQTGWYRLITPAGLALCGRAREMGY